MNGEVQNLDSIQFGQRRTSPQTGLLAIAERTPLLETELRFLERMILGTYSSSFAIE